MQETLTSGVMVVASFSEILESRLKQKKRTNITGIHNKVPSHLSLKFTRRSDVHDRVTIKQNQDLCRLMMGQELFMFRGAEICSRLLNDFKSIESTF